VYQHLLMTGILRFKTGRGGEGGCTHDFSGSKNCEYRMVAERAPGSKQFLGQTSCCTVRHSIYATNPIKLRLSKVLYPDKVTLLQNFCTTGGLEWAMVKPELAWRGTLCG
jgi:hypothetical protein